jgi:hypothetical protein
MLLNPKLRHMRYWFRALATFVGFIGAGTTATAQLNSNVQFWSLPSPNGSPRVVSIFETAT